VTILFGPDEGLEWGPSDPDTTANTECVCPNPDDQYVLEVDAGSVFLIHKACGKQPAGDYLDLLQVDRIPVTVTAYPYGNCDGSQWHGEHRCDCGVVLVATVNGLSVVHNDVPYLVGRDYADTDGALWRITDTVDRQDRPLVHLLPEGAGEYIPLEEAVDSFGPLALAPQVPGRAALQPYEATP
jgi:hypothetical protein